MKNKIRNINKYLLLMCVLIFLSFGCQDNSLSDSGDGEVNNYNSITAFSFLATDNSELSADVAGLIEGVGKTISLTVPSGTDVTTLVPAISIIGSSVSPASDVTTDYTNPVSYTVTAEDGTTQDFTVTVTSIDAKEITAFSFTAAANSGLSVDVIADINGTAITATIPYGTDLTALVATFTNTGELVVVDSTFQISGETVTDFSNPVHYWISSIDSAWNYYEVTVTETEPVVGDLVNYTAGSVPFTMVYVPGGLTFPTGILDDATADVTNNYLIGQTEVTYELWGTVHDWAIHIDRGNNQYTFANPGIQGDDGSRGIQHPVTTIDWRDAMVWTNALTEYYNTQNGTSLEPAYTYNGSIIRDSNDTTCDNAIASSTANGFRLLTSNEWELAARYITDDGDNILGQPGEYYEGNFASGADASYNGTATSDFDGDGDIQNTTDVAVFSPAGATAAVKSKSPNALNLYDMSGNAWEWVFDKSESGRMARGSGWNDIAGYMQLGNVFSIHPYFEFNYVGFRFARTP